MCFISFVLAQIIDNTFYWLAIKIYRPEFINCRLIKNVSNVFFILWYIFRIIPCLLAAIEGLIILVKYRYLQSSYQLTLFRMYIFGAAHGWDGGKKAPLPKISHTHPTMMKLCTVMPYLRKIQKICESCDTHPHFCWHQHFFTGNQQILLYQEIQI